MNAEEWREVKSILQQVMNTPVDQRRALIDVACRDHPARRHEVESLLVAHEAEVLAGDPLRAVVEARLNKTATPPARASDATLRERLQAGLGEQFDILDTLGSGGMGTVFLAHERALGRTVAIKVLRPDHAATAGSRERFRREARIAAQLSHAGIVPLYAFGEVDGLWYFVMEYVRGPSLAQRLENESTLPADEVHRIMLAIAGALEHAHHHGVIHRDIKPANVLLGEASGHPRVADFGIAKVEGQSDSLTMTGSFVGTPLYMSPEQADGNAEVDSRSDIYSLGAVAYTMLTGHPPFDGVDAAVVLSRRRSEDVTHILALAPRIPTDLAHIVMRCLARDRDSRWRDATSLRNALHNSSKVQANDVPEVVADLPGYVLYALIWLVFWMAFAFGSTRSVLSRVLLIVVAVVVPLGPALHVWRVRAQGMRASQLLRLVLRPPPWWGTWWPAPLRATDDVWRQLPAIGRVIRICVAVFVTLAVFVAVTADSANASTRLASHVAVALLVAGTPLAIGFVLRWGLRERLGFDDTMQFLFFSTAPSPFWRQPRIARLLVSNARSVRPPDTAVASDHARAVDELIQRFPEAIGSMGQMARQAVQLQIATIANTEREIARLAPDASADEANRLSRRLATLAEQDAASADHQELGDSVRRQLELVKKFQGQHTAAIARRAALFAQLHAIWLHLSSLVVTDGDGEPRLREAEQRLRTLCERVVEENASD